MRLITFLSDYGTDDEFVGVCHAVIASIAPQARVIDVGHGARGVRWGASMLAAAVPAAPGAVHLAIVDPGVGTRRRPVAVQTPSGATLVGPDNGLLLDAAGVLGGAGAAYEISETRFLRPAPSATFHGRDVFAPAAAHIAAGVDPSELGPSIAPAALVMLPPPRVHVTSGALEADVLRADHFGNVQLAATAADLARAALGPAVTVCAGGREVRASIGTTFGDVASGGLVVYVDSADRLAIAVNGGSARGLLGDPSEVLIRRI